MDDPSVLPEGHRVAACKAEAERPVQVTWQRVRVRCPCSAQIAAVHEVLHRLQEPMQTISIDGSLIWNDFILFTMMTKQYSFIIEYLSIYFSYCLDS